MRVGDSLITKIESALESFEYLGVILTPNSVKSDWVKREVEIALNREIRSKRVKVLPLLFEDCSMPGFLLGKIYADFTRGKYSAGLTELLRALRPSKVPSATAHLDGQNVVSSERNSIPLYAYGEHYRDPERGNYYKRIGDLEIDGSLDTTFVEGTYLWGERMYVELRIPHGGYQPEPGGSGLASKHQNASRKPEILQ